MAALIPKNTLQLARRQTICATSVAVQVCHNSCGPKVIKSPTTASLKRGTGGRSSFNGIVCTIFGATGFIGPYVANQLGKIGTQLIVPYRGDFYDARDIKLAGDLGQVLFHPFDLRDEESIRRCIKYSNVVVNLIGRDYETKNFKFHDVHVEGARRIARLCKESGNVERLIHVSCLNADPNPKPLLLKEGSKYYKTKWEGELAVREEFPEAIIIRPSVIYGQEDRFLWMYSHKWRYHMRFLPLWKKGEQTEKQPICANDVAKGIAAAVVNRDIDGKTYQFVGPHRYKLSNLIDWIFEYLTYKPKEYGVFRADIKYTPLFALKVSLNEFISPAYPLACLHWEGIEKECTTDNVQKDLPMLEDLGVIPQTMESRIAWEMEYMQWNGPFQVPFEHIDAIPAPPTVTVK